MKLTHLTSTADLTTVNGAPCRRWEGMTTSGLAVHVFIAAVAAREDGQLAELEESLKVTDPAERKALDALLANRDARSPAEALFRFSRDLSVLVAASKYNIPYGPSPAGGLAIADGAKGAEVFDRITTGAEAGNTKDIVTRLIQNAMAELE